MSLEGFQKKLMEFYRKGKERPLMDALTAMMAEAIMTLCDKCQSDRLVCALKPLCGDRKYTSLLADMGATDDEIKKTHAFCFSNHLSRLSDISENREPLGSVKDAKFPLSTFVRVILARSKKDISDPSLSSGELDPKRLSELLEQVMTRALGRPIVTYKDNLLLLLGGKNGIIQIDLNKKVATLNPENELIGNNAHLKSVVQILSSLYSLDVKIEEVIKGLDYLNFTFQLPFTVQGKKSAAEALANLARKLHDDGMFSTVLQSAEGDRIRLLVELRPPMNPQSPYKIGFCYAYLRNMILMVAKTVTKKTLRE
nr:hypothetical protein [Candidatus Njordarchaeum guaymaensis]